MKLKYEFQMVDMGKEICAVPVGENSSEFRGALQLNSAGAKMLKYIGECETEKEVLEKLILDYPNDDAKEIEESLHEFIDQLTKENLLIP